ncbi:MAG: HlyD family efflux transporter periplasmic adaptor subunit [Rhodobacteraceae bacterium]|nr:HlyD family efflux transporter periplasmic adaptor subunit [Paracoccaceae bacterium]
MPLLSRLAVVLTLLIPSPLAAQQEEWIAAIRGTVDIEGGLMRLAAQREGLIAEVLVKEGDRVTEGQVLARIDAREAELQMRTAELEFEQARIQGGVASMRLGHAEDEVARLSIMAAVDAIPRKDIDAANRALDLARAEADQARVAVALAENRLAVARLDIAAREVRAPVAGVILRRSARVGDATTTNTVTEMFLLAPDGARVLKGQLTEQFVGQVRPGQEASLISERDGDIALRGRVLRIAPIFGTPGPGQANPGQTEANSVEIVISIDDEAARDLILGERLVARIRP